jgi:nicotinamide riboside kinase
MYSFALAQPGAAETVWAKAQALAALHSAIEALDDARASLAVLTSDTDWHSDGVRAMQESLEDLRLGARVEASEMRSRESEAERIDVS